MNTFYHGDCLFVMNHDIEPNSIDLIYLDPPFFTGKKQTGVAKWKPGEMPITYEDGKQFWKEKGLASHAPEWMKHVALTRPDFAAYLFYMMERLEACHKVLKDTGSIYLHCDWRASHYLKMVMDEIFGYKYFRNEIVWHYHSSVHPQKDFQRYHDTMLRYSKSNGYLYNMQYDSYAEATIKRFDRIDENGKRYKEVMKRGVKYIVYMKDNGLPAGDVWNIPFVIGTSKEKVGYPTQKPLALLERIIKASSNEGDTILDPFCGCGTAIIAAHKEDRQWVGIDISNKAWEVIQDRSNQPSFYQWLNSFKEATYISRELPEVSRMNPYEFEAWVNGYFKATKPSPDNRVDGITHGGTPIQTKTNLVSRHIVTDLVANAKYHSQVKQPFDHAIIVSQKGFDNGARQRQFEIKSKEGITVDLFTPADMLPPQTMEGVQ